MPISVTNAVFLAIAALKASAHVVMIEPHPYNLDTPPLLQTWPLSADLPFPCQGRFQHAEEVTTVTAGTTQTVKFWGSAVHGGGSCQFSIAYGDNPPTDPAAWHAIYSIIGGCPAEAQGNIPTDSKDPHGRENGPQCGNDVDKECTRQFNIPIPKDMKNGPSMFAWTWFNKIGNREMYMVCAPINVVGGVDSDDFVDSLPPIFQANFPGHCTTGESGSVIGFPNPGKYGKVYQDITPGSNGSCEPAGDPKFENADQPAPQPSASSKKPLPPATTPHHSPSSTVTSTGSYTTPAHTTFPNSTFTVPSTKPTHTSFGNQTTTPSAAPTPSGIYIDLPVNSTRPGWAVGMIPCKTSGALVCVDAGHFGICNHGWAQPQAVAAGTACVDGAIVSSAGK